MLKNLIELHRQGRLDDAEQGYRAHLLEHPNDAEVHHLLGQLRHQRGELAEAEQLVQRAHELAPGQPLILLTLGGLRTQQNDLATARGHYEQALALDPNLAAAHSALGHVLLAKGDGDAAEQHFHMALRVGSDEHALAGLGAIALDKGDTAAALRHLTRAAENGSQDASIHLLLAQAFLAQGTPAFAEQALNNALRLNPELMLAHGLLAETLLQAGRHNDAEPHYRKLADSTQYATASTIGLADIARARGHFDDAAKGYQSALASGAQPPMVIKAYAWTLTRLGRLDEAIVAYEQYLALVPNDDDARRGRAELLTVANHLVDAQAAWQELSERHPDDPTPHARLAILSDYTGDFAAALKHADWIEAHTPGEVESTLVRIRAQLRDGNHAAAEALLLSLDQHTDLSEGPARLRLNYRGRLHDQAGEYADAARCFSEAQSRAASDLPALAEPSPQLAEVLAETPGPRWAEAPILLLGLPGSGVEQIAALLADQPDLVVLRDRIGTRLRNDDFNAPNFTRYLGDIDDADLNEIRTRYLGPLREIEIDTSRPRVEWLPRWDAHLLALVRRVMLGTRIIIVERDPRAALLNWLAFGWAPNIGCPDVAQAAEWMTRAQYHLDIGADLDEPRRLRVDADAVLADPANAGAVLAKFLNIERLQAGANSARAQTGLGGLPIAFAGDHWQHYRDALSGPFAALENNI